jgi:hypothetical protein
MGEALPEGVSRQEFSELSGAVSELRDAVAGLRQARSEPERREAREDVRDAKADLAEVAKELGLDPKRLEEAAGQARSADEKERLRPLLIELLDEELAEAPEELLDDAKETVKETAPEPPQPDTAPGLGHWSERPLSSLFGGEGK